MAYLFATRRPQLPPAAAAARTMKPFDACEKLVATAEKELAAFVRAVELRLGVREAQLAAEDWLESLASDSDFDARPGMAFDFRKCTVAAAHKLAQRILVLPSIPAAGTSSTFSGPELEPLDNRTKQPASSAA